MDKLLKDMTDEESREYVINHPFYLLLNPDIKLYESKRLRYLEINEILESNRTKKSEKEINVLKNKIAAEYETDEEDDKLLDEKEKRIKLLDYCNSSNSEIEALLDEKELLMYWLLNKKNHEIMSPSNREAAYQRTKDRLLSDQKSEEKQKEIQLKEQAKQKEIQLKEEAKQKAIQLKEEAKQKKLDLQLKVLQLKAEAMQ
jgi:hypothetical protein